MTTFNSLDIIKIIFKWRKPILWVTGIFVVLGGLISAPQIMKPKYKSVSILYPANLTAYGSESTTEQMLQILESEELMNEVSIRLDLKKHYDISETEKYPHTVLMDEIKKNIDITKTEFESVEIKVLDQDPKFAVKIIETIIEEFNNKARNLQREKTLEIVNLAKSELDKKKRELDSMEVAIRDIRVNDGIINYEAQSKVVTKEYLRALAKDQKSVSLGKVSPMFESLQQNGGNFIALSENLWRVRGNYNDIKLQYENALKDINKQLTYANIITHAFPAEKKSYPIRWLIVLGAGISALILSVLTALIVENFKKVQVQVVTKDPLLQSINDN